MVLKELNSARAQLERVLSLHDSVDYNALRMIAKFKIWGQKMYIFTFHIVKNHRKCGVFFFKNKHDYKCDIDFIQKFNKQ